FEREISVIVARDLEGRMVTYEPAENVHVAGILDTSSVPAAISASRAAAARDLAMSIARDLDLVGVLAVELFVLPNGRLMVNELAPRPHNSGHWSIEACRTSQFEQQVRTVVGAPVGPTDLLTPAATANLLGDLWEEGTPRWDRVLTMPDVKLHLYGKEGSRRGRKMGHLTILGPTAEEARERVLAARALLVSR
ncbi:MAG TPA: ATP-grasp domain-containing protein, partial [Chloroflexota bacterium]|nr:ATP-grasp domain-containing protein [Chloroflexota bacterium]